MTPYRERRQKGFYSPTGEAPQNTTASNLGGLGVPQSAKPKARKQAKTK